MHLRDVGSILVGFGFLWIVFMSITRQLKKAERVPVRGKFKAAQEWLEESGYEIIRTRERVEWNAQYDSKSFDKSLIADFIVRQGPKSYVVKVANPRDEKSVTGGRIREQWYPLYVAFGVDGILHIDLDEEEVHVLEFSVRSPSYILWKRILNRTIWLALGALLGLLLFHGH